MRLLYCTSDVFLGCDIMPLANNIFVFKAFEGNSVCPQNVDVEILDEIQLSTLQNFLIY